MAHSFTGTLVQLKETSQGSSLLIWKTLQEKLRRSGIVYAHSTPPFV